MIVKRTFLVTGYRPEAMSIFIRACDLGIEGAFYPFLEEATITLSPNCTEEQRGRHADAIKVAYEATGHRDVRVVEDYL